MVSHDSDFCAIGRSSSLDRPPLGSGLPISRPLNVLFYCRDGSAVSILAEAILNAIGTGRFKAHSACRRAGEPPSPCLIELLDRNRLSVVDPRGRAEEEFVGPGAPALDLAIGLGADDGRLPPQSSVGAHWESPDPAAVAGGEGERRKAYARGYNLLFHRLTLFVGLPFASLDRPALELRLAEIGRTPLGRMPRRCNEAVTAAADNHPHVFLTLPTNRRSVSCVS
jgi:protein-tyrosine-phosphatase